ncbi:MAG TPA: hypothetical protein VFW94_24275 [Candidatus Acidoferrales bacterium]|nr:hypothetical protein [Candidatus Acidoferrales bacterium]
MLEIDEGVYITPEHVTLIKEAGDGKCVLFVSGQSPLDGFVIDRPADEVAQDIADELGVDLNTVFGGEETEEHENEEE